MAIFVFILCVVVGYLLGSVCSAVIVCRLFALPDPRTKGSNNPGATNVLRIAGKQYALIVLIADLLKGLLPVLLSKLLDGGPTIQGFTCLAAVLGHMFPVFFNFKGGKGVATTFGGLLGMNFILGTVVIAVWLVVANFTHYVSLASMVAIVFSPFFSLFAYHNEYAFTPLLLVVFFVLYQHRNNMNRLIDGTEPKVSFRGSTLATNDATVLSETLNETPVIVETTVIETSIIEPQAEKPVRIKKKASGTKPPETNIPHAKKPPKATKKPTKKKPTLKPDKKT